MLNLKVANKRGVLLDTTLIGYEMFITPGVFNGVIATDYHLLNRFNRPLAREIFNDRADVLKTFDHSYTLATKLKND